MSMGGDAATESMTFELLKRLSQKLDEHPNNPELKKAMKEIGEWAIEALPIRPHWVYTFREKFGP